MARVSVERVVDHLSFRIKRALWDTIKHFYPDCGVDRNMLFKEFKKQIRRKCSSREIVPDQLVSKICPHCSKTI